MKIRTKNYFICVLLIWLLGKNNIHTKLSPSINLSIIIHSIHRTLYCAKGNYEFGITRVMKSLEPYNKKV